jgi:hypothetical protein
MRSFDVKLSIEYSNRLKVRVKMTIWLYNIDEEKSKKIKSEIFDLNLSG